MDSVPRTSLTLEYKPSVYDSLHHYQEAKDWLSNNEVPKELMEVVSNSQYKGKVGIALLHKHFDLCPKERLVETKGDYFSFIQPKTYSEVSPCDQKEVPYIWKLGDQKLGERPNIFYPLEFTEINEADKELVERLSSDSVFLGEIGRKLGELGLINIFGLTIAHRYHITRIDGTSMEYTDEKRRILHIVPTSRAPVDQEMQGIYDIHDVDEIQTSWFSENLKEEENFCKHVCRHACRGHGK